jgi:hypothetical protein
VVAQRLVTLGKRHGMVSLEASLADGLLGGGSMERWRRLSGGR